MSKLEDLLEQHTDEKVYEALVNASEQMETFIGRVFSDKTPTGMSNKSGALTALYFLRSLAENSNPDR